MASGRGKRGYGSRRPGIDRPAAESGFGVGEMDADPEAPIGAVFPSRAPDYLRLADLFGVARPSLSRGFSEYYEQGILQSEGRTMHILDKKRLKAVITKD